ncbi:uncharacterized protein BP5553_06482 [Venustampulla echinocandica]|uniref:Uncharacterized protein n=1 Tax=Venustampulla echinocandica TaxID=2656787 RepID=A0A370TK16_9HELO|nr:uncharacterized protein BP5553_06482 [Venustampulla echinocandica]RDL35870.1 hypothetical protein BP5553_06482 [Venustampulla echinocandica]
MKAFTSLSAASLLTTAAVAVTLPPNTPIYIGELTTPSSTNQIAWLPSPKFCTKATTVLGSGPFSLKHGGAEDIANLQFTGYSASAASLTKDGKIYADCVVGPDSVELGDRCPKLVKEEGHVRRTWTCWVKEEETTKAVEEEDVVKPMKNIAKPPPKYAEEGGTYQKWTCDEKGCKPDDQVD